jgi:hypothetical protein
MIEERMTIGFSMPWLDCATGLMIRQMWSVACFVAYS